MKKNSIPYWAYMLARFSLGAVFAYAGFIKLLDPKAFAKIISQYDIVPDFLLPYTAIGLPAIELLSGLGLIFNLRGSLFTVFLLLALFMSVLGYGMYNNMNVDCGCFSEEEIKSIHGLRIAFYRDILMMAAVVFVYSYRKFSDKSRYVRFKKSIKEE